MDVTDNTCMCPHSSGWYLGFHDKIDHASTFDALVALYTLSKLISCGMMPGGFEHWIWMAHEVSGQTSGAAKGMVPVASCI